MRETFALVRKTPGCLLLLFGNFAITFGSNLVLPYLAVYLTVEQGISPWAVGAAFTAKLWAQQGLMVFGGSLADRIGTVPTMCLGLLMRALSYLLVVTAVSDAGAVLACGLLGLGSALYIPAGNASARKPGRRPRRRRVAGTESGGAIDTSSGGTYAAGQVVEG